MPFAEGGTHQVPVSAYRWSDSSSPDASQIIYISSFNLHTDKAMIPSCMISSLCISGLARVGRPSGQKEKSLDECGIKALELLETRFHGDRCFTAPVPLD